MFRSSAVLGFCAVTITGCGGGASTGPAAPTEPTKADMPKAQLKLDRGPGKTTKRRIAIQGIATPGLRVSGDGERVISKKNGRFTLGVPLKVGRNRITVYAQGPEVQGSREDIVVKRVKPPRPPEPAADSQPAPSGSAPPPVECPPNTASNGIGGCGPTSNEYYEDKPQGDAYGDQIPETPFIDGE